MKQPKQRRWRMPDWMKPYAPLFINTGREPTVEAIEEMYNGRADPLINLPLSTLEACVKSQVGFLMKLHQRNIILPHTEWDL
jgi:hypothetical protein